MDANELHSELSSANLEARVGFLSEVGRTVNGALGWYFEPRAFERWEEGLLYKVLGVHYFKKIVPTGGEYVNRIIGYHPIKDAESREEGLINWEKHTRVCETAHCIFSVIMLLPALAEIADGDHTRAVITTAVNIAGNVYPILLQRYNRARIYNALEKLESMEDQK